jgi:FkbM family methyltransferase
VREVNFRGTVLAIPSDELSILPTLLDGTYERRELDLFCACCSPGATVLDIGANIGIFTVLAANAVGTEGCVVAFEPVPTNVDLLRRNLRSNSGAERVHVVEAAVGSHPGELTLYLEEHSVGTHSAEVRANRATATVPMVTIDETVESLELGRVDVIKIDIEGYEEHAVRGAERTIERDRPTILIEMNQPLLIACGTDPATLVELLTPLYDYRYRVAGDVVRPFDTTDEALAVKTLQNLVFSTRAITTR